MASYENFPSVHIQPDSQSDFCLDFLLQSLRRQSGSWQTHWAQSLSAAEELLKGRGDFFTLPARKWGETSENQLGHMNAFFLVTDNEVCEPFAVEVRTCERRRSLTCWGQKDASEILWAEMHTPKNKKHKKLSKKDSPVSVCYLWNVTNQTELGAGHNRHIKNAFI